eukprot:scaffold106154_cov37-Tisochrysis_lutea.AAC.1
MASLRLASKSRKSLSADFLGAQPEAPAAGSTEEQYARGWALLDADELEAAIGVFDELLLTESQNEKVWLSRAEAQTRRGEYQRGLADYGRYLEMATNQTGAVYANAQYGRALCLAQLGHKLEALLALDACIAAGPKDEQLTDKDTSSVPAAHVAKCVMLQDVALAARYTEVISCSSTQPKQSGPSIGERAAAADGQSPDYTGKVWEIPPSALEEALDKARALGKTPLLLDPSEEHFAEAYFLYNATTVLDGKRMVVETRTGAVDLNTLRDALRRDLVHALRWGHTLLVRMGDAAAPFTSSYCKDDACFPLSVFDASKSPAGRSIDTQSVGKEDPFANVLRAGETIGGKLAVPKKFRVVVASYFGRDRYENYLHEALPLHFMQPISILAPAENHVAVVQRQQLGGINQPSIGSEPKAMQLQGDRTSLFLQS